MVQARQILSSIEGVTTFDATVINAVTGHMNGDHPEDSLLIARAFGYPEATASTMTGLDAEGGVWSVTDANGQHELRVAWPGGPISERPEIRREVVMLYRAACAELGVSPRQEEAPEASHGAHAAAPSDGHPHGAAGSHGSAGSHGGGHPHAAPADDGSFSSALRRATWGDHGDSEHSTFMEDIMQGRASKADYAALAAQHYFVYLALEEAATQFADDPAYAALHPDALVRLPALEADLEFLLGPNWRDEITAVPATEAYAARIREVAAEGWKPGIVAHHYTRYLGDLSGGQAIARLVARQHGFDEAGVSFYAFPELGPIPHFKAQYRAHLDAIGASLSADELARVVDEVRAAYAFNTQTFFDLDRARLAPA